MSGLRRTSKAARALCRATSCTVWAWISSRCIVTCSTSIPNGARCCRATASLLRFPVTNVMTCAATRSESSPPAILGKVPSRRLPVVLFLDVDGVLIPYGSAEHVPDSAQVVQHGPTSQYDLLDR